jgi:tetratricopeptide (TPR) repeat protein
MFRNCWIVIFLCSASIAAAQTNPEHEKTKSEAEAAYQKGDFAKAEQLTSSVLAQNPKDHAALFIRASSRVELGVMKRDVAELREGIQDARESLKVGGNTEINYYLPYLYGMIALANIEDKKEHAQVAVDVATKSILTRQNLKPEQKANVLYQRAAAYIYLKDLNAAIEDYQSAVKADPTHLPSQVGLAESYVVAGQPDKALAAFTSAVETFPDNHLVYNNRGLFLQQQGRPQDALNDFNKALELDKNFAIAYTNRGYTQQAIGNLPEAEQDFSKALSIDPNNPLFTSLRGTCRLSQGNTAGAIEDYTQAIRLAPQNPVAQADLGFARFFSKDYAGAYDAFEQASQIDVKAMRYLNPWKLWSLVLAGKPDAIAEIAAPSVAKPEKDRDWIDALVLFLNGKTSEQDLVNFVAKVTDERMKNAQLCEAYFFIAERRNQAKDKANATAFYKQVIQTKASQLSAFRGAQYALNSFGK